MTKFTSYEQNIIIMKMAKQGLNKASEGQHFFVPVQANILKTLIYSRK